MPDSPDRVVTQNQIAELTASAKLRPIIATERLGDDGGMFGYWHNDVLIDQVNEDNYQDEVLDRKGVSVVHAIVSFSEPDRLQAQMMNEVAKKYNPTESLDPDMPVRFYYFYAEDNQQLIVSQEIVAIPTVFVYRDGKLMSRFQAVIPATSDLITAIEQALAATPEQLATVDSAKAAPPTAAAPAEDSAATPTS